MLLDGVTFYCHLFIYFLRHLAILNVCFFSFRSFPRYEFNYTRNRHGIIHAQLFETYFLFHILTKQYTAGLKLSIF